jgi:hypothetical protein
MSEHTSNYSDETIAILDEMIERLTSERDEWRDLAQRMRDCLDGSGKQSELVAEFDRKTGA